MHEVLNAVVAFRTSPFATRIAEYCGLLVRRGGQGALSGAVKSTTFDQLQYIRLTRSGVTNNFVYYIM